MLSCHVHREGDELVAEFPTAKLRLTPPEALALAAQLEVEARAALFPATPIRTPPVLTIVASTPTSLGRKEVMTHGRDSRARHSQRRSF